MGHELIKVISRILSLFQNMLASRDRQFKEEKCSLFLFSWFSLTAKYAGHSAQLGFCRLFSDFYHCSVPTARK